MKKVMKTSIGLILGLTFLVSCGGEAWPEDKVKSLKDQCMKQFESTPQINGEETCGCLIDKLKEKYSSYDEANEKAKEDQKWITNQTMECAKMNVGGAE